MSQHTHQHPSTLAKVSWRSVAETELSFLGAASPSLLWGIPAEQRFVVPATPQPQDQMHLHRLLAPLICVNLSFSSRLLSSGHQDDYEGGLTQPLLAASSLPTLLRHLCAHWS